MKNRKKGKTASQAMVVQEHVPAKITEILESDQAERVDENAKQEDQPGMKNICGI